MNRKKTFQLMILILILYSFLLNFLFLKNIVSNRQKNRGNYDYDEIVPEYLKTSDYSSFIEGNGENINLSLQQSLLDDSPIIISNISDSNNNKFYEPSPTVENFDSFFVNITIEDIYAPNKILIIEDYLPIAGSYDFTNAQPGATSFKINGNGYLENISVIVRNTDTVETVVVGFYIYNSTWNSTTQKSIPDGRSPLLDTYIIPVGDIIGWYTITNQHYYLDNSKTENKTWFIGLYDMGLGDARWAYVDDDSAYFGSSDDDNETWSYYKFGLDWLLIDNPGSGCPTVDLELKVDLAPYIYPSEKTLIVEDQSTGILWNFGITGSPAYGSFRIRGNTILENISIWLWNNGDGTDCNFRVRIFNSQWTGTKNEPLGLYATVVPIDAVLIDGFDGWYNFTDLNTFLNVSETDNNTFYVVMQDVDDDTYWYMISDDIIGDNDDEMDAYYYSGGYQLITIGPRTVDLSLKVGLKPHKNIPKPEDIGLKINNTAVIGDNDIHGFGYWNSTQEYSSSSGQLEFKLSADWWDVLCKITLVQINYTKTDLKANSMYRVLGSGQEVIWNVSRNSGLDFFDARLSNYRINFTVPSSWNNIQVFNGPIDKTNDISINPEKKGYKTVQVANAGNGTYWHLTATSENLLSSIDTYVNSNPTNTVMYSDIVQFNTTFTEKISQNDGIINLSVYNPIAINDKLNFTSVNSTYGSSTEFYLGSWDVSDTITRYGGFRVQVFWSNNTAVGFWDKVLTIIGETDLSLLTPSQDATFYTNQSFDIIVYFEDFNLLTSIDGATIEYNINGQGLQSTIVNNGTIGYYVIPVDCTVFTSDGLKSVDISANKQYYDSQLLTYYFNVIVVEEPSMASRPAIPGYNIIALIGLCFGITIALIKNKYKK